MLKIELGKAVDKNAEKYVFCRSEENLGVTSVTNGIDECKFDDSIKYLDVAAYSAISLFPRVIVFDTPIISE
jgi:hypothetical protein